MAISLFVPSTAKIAVKVYAYLENGNTVASSERSDSFESKEEATVMTFHFRRPNYKDGNNILRALKISSSELSEENSQINVIELQEKALKNLLVSVDTDEASQELSLEMIDNLDPQIARAAVGGLLEKISL